MSQKNPKVPKPEKPDVDKPLRKRPPYDTYHLEMDDGKQFSIPAPNAGRACFMALNRYKGHRVKRCWRGDGFSGRLDFDVPVHDPLTKRPKRPAPEQTEMFPTESLVSTKP